MITNQEAERKRLITLCQVARAKLGWDDEIWTAIKKAHGGFDSLAEMDVKALRSCLDHAKRCGFKPTVKGHPKRPAKPGLASVLRAIWLEMAALGIIRDSGEAALCSWASNSRDGTVTTALHLLTDEQLHAAVERLKQWRLRALMQGRLVCPQCGFSFRPTKKQAAAFPGLACDRHEPAAHYQWDISVPESQQ